MAPRAKSAAFIVDGVQCSVDLKSRVVTVGSKLVGHDERDRFKLPVGVPLEPREQLEAQVSERAHSRPKFAALAARAAGADPMPMQVDIDKVAAAAGSAGYQPATEVFGADCPVESSSDAFEWYVWQQMQRGTDADGKPTYSPEWLPHRGTRAEFFAEYRGKVREWLQVLAT